MKTLEEKVRTREGEEFEFTMTLPESTNEAKEVYGDENATFLLNGGLKTKKQNAVREAFRQGKTREQAEEVEKAYRPGATSRKSAKSQALELITENSDNLKNDNDLKSKVHTAFMNSNFKEVISLLDEE